MIARVRLTYSRGGQPVQHVFQLHASRSTQDLLAALPLELTLSNYANTELIADLPRRLSTAGTPPSHDARRGDLCYYAPWGNLALFRKDQGKASGLVLLGRAELGFDAPALSSPTHARLEALES